MKQRRWNSRKKSKYQKSFVPRLKDRGSSLVEIIVSMLVLAIIVIPMLNMFVTSNRINLNTRQKQYANVVLENTMEEIKAGSILRDPLNVDPSNPNRFIEPTFTRSQGTGSFDVEVSFEVVPGDINPLVMPEINAFDEENTEVFLVESLDLEEVVGYFTNLNIIATNEENQKKLEEAREDYLLEYENWYQEWLILNPDTEPGPGDGQPVFDETTVPTLTPAPVNEIRNKIKRETRLKLELDGTKWRITGEFRYVMPYDSVSGIVLTRYGQVDGEVGEQITPLPAGDWYDIDKLNFLYVLYQPFINETRDQCLIDMDAVTHMRQLKCDMYFVQQSIASPFRLPVKMIVSTVPVWEKFQVYGSNINLTYSKAGISFPTYDTLVPVNTNPDKKMFKVTVRVRTEGSTEVLAEADTWMYEKKE